MGWEESKTDEGALQGEGASAQGAVRDEMETRAGHPEGLRHLN